MFGHEPHHADPYDFTLFINWIGLIANIFAVMFFISPIFLIINLHKKELTPEDTPYLLMAMNIKANCLWLSLAYKIKDYYIMAANIIGFPLNIIYLCFFFYYYLERRFIKSLVFIIPTILISLGLFLILILVIKHVNFSRYSSMIFNILTYVAVGQKIVDYI